MMARERPVSGPRGDVDQTGPDDEGRAGEESPDLPAELDHVNEETSMARLYK